LQTTLLGLAIAIILALVAALVGPVLVDWDSHRSMFEAEASRIIGVNVRVAGAIDARLLPSPQLLLHDIEIGGGAETIRARSLGVELALGPLMRGEWRAAEMHLAGPRVSLGLDKSGQVRAPNMAVAFKPDELSVDRLSIEDGTLTLADVASGTNLTLSRVSFIGEARSLVGPVKGEGSVTIDGKLYPYRLTVGRLSEERTLKLHVNVDPVDRPLSVDIDGALALAGGEPRFDGTLSMSRPVGIGSRSTAQSGQSLSQSWRMSGKIKASGQSALIENIEFLYGSEDQGAKLTGVADFKFGAHPHLDGVLSGRQIDLDRAATNADGVRQPPAAAIRGLAESAASAFRPRLPVQIGVGIDQLTLGGNSVQNLRGDITSNADGWTLDGLEFRAPGLTQVRLSGRLAVGSDGVTFTGPAKLDTSDPKAFVAWLEGRSETGQNALRPLSLRGEVTLAKDTIAVDSLKAEFDRKPIAGRFAYRFASGSRPAGLDVEFKAPQFDIDGALKFGRALLAGSALEQPREISVDVDIGRATFDEIEMRDARARFRVDARGLQLDRLSVNDLAGGKLAASGRVETGGHPPRGSFSLDFETKQTAAIVAKLEKFAPNNVGQAGSLLGRIGHAKLHATLDIAADGKTSGTIGRFAATGDLDDLRFDTHARIRGDWGKHSVADVAIDGTVDAQDGTSLVKLMSLDRFVAPGKGPAQLKGQIEGPIGGDMTFDVRLSATGLSAQARGSGQISENRGAKIAATLRVMDADLRPLRPPGTTSAVPLPLTLTSRVAIADGALKFDDIDAKLAGSSVRGHLAADNASPQKIDGVLEADRADLPALIACAIGLPSQTAGANAAWSWPSDPFSAGALGKFIGTVALKVGRADLLPGVTAREFSTTLRFGPDDIAVRDATGNIAGGQFSGQLTLRRKDDGLAAHAKVSLTGADASAMMTSRPRPVVTGSLGLTVEVEGAGLSPVALIGSLEGSGKIVLTDGRVAGLDPQIFDTVNRAVDEGLAIEPGRIADLVSKSLERGELSLKRAESALHVSVGQFRLTNAVIDSKDARLAVAGTLDLTDGSVDARLEVIGLNEAAGARPNIVVSLKGPLATPTRSIDVSALTGWLTLRAIENQTKTLRAIESAPSQLRGKAAPPNKQAPALPAPIDIRPAPAPRSARQPASSVGSQN
jgi:large subunit ribosomal protein L24